MGLVVALGLILGIACFGGIVFAVRKYYQRYRRGNDHLQDSQRQSAVSLILQPTVEVTGYTEWEMATIWNAHEVPGTVGTRKSRGS